jgi:hypothetical protein
MTTSGDARIAKLVSGGQTGADRAALDVAIERHLPHGGWCPRGGWAEDLPTPPGLLAAYAGLVETPDVDPAQRTAWNVRDSDVTLVVAASPGASPGTQLTLEAAEELGRPHLSVDPTSPDACERVTRLLESLQPGLVVNVAGPRESEAPGTYTATRRLLDRVLDGIGPPTPRAAG